MEIIKPILRGKDVKRYNAEFSDLWLITTFPSLRLDINDYPAIRDYLKTFGTRLDQTGEKGCRKKTNHKWFEIQDNIAYYKQFQKEKVLYREISNQMDAFYDKKGLYINNKLYMVTGNSIKYLTAILNSVIFNNVLLKQANLTGGKGVGFLRNIPIPKLTTEAQKPFIILVDTILSKKERGDDTTEEENQIDQLVYKLYDLTPEEIQIVEEFNEGK
jgi:hypothetical protein